MVFENGACGSLITPLSPGKNSAAAAKWFRVLGGGNLAITLVLVGEEIREVWKGSCCSLGNAV